MTCLIKYLVQHLVERGLNKVVYKEQGRGMVREIRRFHWTLFLHSIILFQYQLSKNADVDDKKKMEEKILSILSDPKATFDPDHALILSQMHGFSRGTLFLYEKKGLHDQVQFEKVLVVQL